jgi:acyl carrier protein
MSAPPGVTARVLRLLHEALKVDAFPLEADLIEAGLIDSLALVELLAAIEQEFDIELPLDQLDVDSLRTVETIAEFVANSGGLNGASES